MKASLCLFVLFLGRPLLTEASETQHVQLDTEDSEPHAIAWEAILASSMHPLRETVISWHGLLQVDPSVSDVFKDVTEEER